MLKNLFTSNFNRSDFFKILKKGSLLAGLIYIPFALALTYFPSSILNNNYGFSRFQKKMTGPSSKKRSFDHIFFGSSLPMTNIRAHELDSTLVLGGNLMTIIPNYYMFKRYLKNNPAPKTIYVSPQLGFVKEKDYWEALKLNYMSYEDVLDVMKTSLRVKDWPSLEKNVLTYFFKAFSIHYKLIHSYLPELKSGLFDPRADRQEVVRKTLDRYNGYVNYREINRVLRIRKLSLKRKALRVREKNSEQIFEKKGKVKLPLIHEHYAKRMAELASKNNIRLVYLLYPVSPLRSRQLPKEVKTDFKNYYTSLMKGYKNVHVWIYKDHYGRDKFVDASHLNAKGSIFFKKEVKNLYREVEKKFN